MDTATQTPAEQAYELIDMTIGDLKGINFIESQKMTDLLLDLRILIGKMEDD